MLLGLLALAIVDSINPSAIAVTLHMLSRGWAPAQVVAYVAAIFVTYLALGSTERKHLCRVGASRRDGDRDGVATAVPYFGAIALLTTADLPFAQWLTLLVLYNAIFVLPPLLLLAGHIVFGERLDARYAELRERLQAGAREAMLWILGLAGGGLLVWSVVEYVARFG